MDRSIHDCARRPESGIKLEGPWTPNQVEKIRAYAETVRAQKVDAMDPICFVAPLGNGFQEWADGESEH